MKKGATGLKEKRYRLWRIWAEDRPFILFLLLNPSWGDATHNDPTIKRLLFFAKELGYGGFYLGNLYAHITPYPKALLNMDLKPEEENIKHIKEMLSLCQDVAYAWGNNGSYPDWLKALKINAFCFGQNKNGSPKHPLYLPKTSLLVPFKQR